MYISSDIDAVTLETAVPHEATHVMLQQGFSQYQEFVDSTADCLQMKSDAAFDLMYLIAEHCGIDVFDMSAAEQKSFYSELNATVYGMYQGGILDDPRYDYGTWIPGAFKDFAGYIRQMDAIHAAFRQQNGLARTDPSGGAVSEAWSPGSQPTSREALAWVLENKELQKIDPRTRTLLQEYGRHLQQLQTIERLRSDLQPTSTDANTSQLAGRNLAKLEQLYAHHAQRLAELEKNPRLQRLAQQTLTELAPTEPENVENSQNEDVDIIRTYDRINDDEIHSEAETDGVVEIELSRTRYPQSAQHILDAVSRGMAEILTIDREHAKENRRRALAGMEKSSEYDLDEYPPAMFKEGGEGASVRRISPSDNRGAGSVIGHQLRGYPDGTKIKIKIVD